MKIGRERGFAKLWAAQAISNLGDGMYGTALPLLAATLTRDPLLVSVVSFAEWLPWLLFGLVSGALLDRWDRRRVIWTVDAARCVIVGGLAVAVLLDQATIALLAAVGFLLGTGQTLVDTGSQSILPTLVSRDRDRLERANGRLVGTQVVTQELAGPPAGGFLFSVATWAPFAVDAVSFAAGSTLVAAIRGRFGPTAEDIGPGGRRTTLRAEIAEGLRWLAAHRVLRATAVMVAVVNLLAAGGGAVTVLFAQEELGLDSLGFGLLLSGSAVGGVLGSLVAARLARVVGTAGIVVWTIVLSALAYLSFGLSTDPWLAGAMFGLVGFFTVVFNVVLGSLRQALTPDRLLGRVISAFRLFSYGATPIGSLLGGLVARSFGLRAPFVIAGVVIPVAALVCLPAINARTIAEARTAAGLDPRP
ncbi:MAG TPA: MFS transporter [Actinomycetes bacterium]|nr:MFS transporter [Actinomycetes bacterium]